MAIINRFFIRRYKEILIDVPAGTIQGPGFSTFNLDSPNPNPNGTSDFLGVIKQSVLIGEIYKDTADTNPKRLRQDPIPIARFQQLTDAEYLGLVQSGDIVINPQTGGESQIIGWVELGKSYPSFYYQPCANGKQPRADNYFDFNDIQLSLYKVRGEGVGPQALEQIGNWNINETYGNWGTITPSNEPFLFKDYILMSIGGQGVYGLPFLNNQRLNSIPLLMADRDEHFARNETSILGPSFSNPLSRTPTTEKIVFGRSRIVIVDGFRPFTEEQKSVIGKCLDKPGVVGPGGPVGPGPDPGTPDTGGDGGDVTDDVVVTEPCAEPYPINYPPYNILTGDESYVNTILFDIDGPADTTAILRNMYQSQDVFFGQRDPREPLNENYSAKNGIIWLRPNKKTCTTDVYPALRDKDGDIPEQIGPAMSNYFKNTRERLSSLYGIDRKILKNIGTGSDGYDYFSDGNSYTELLGETVIGCGDQISFGLDIPEIRAEIINNIEDKFYKKDTVLKTANARQSIGLHTMDLIYGMMSGQEYIQRKGDGENFKIPGVWQNVMYPIYDKLAGRVVKSLYEFPSDATVANMTFRPEYSIIDSAISIEQKESFDGTQKNNQDQKVLTNWDWLLQKGFGAFTLNFTYQAGPNGISDTANSKTTFSVDIDYVAAAQFGIGLLFLIYDLFSSEEEELPRVSVADELVDDRERLLIGKTFEGNWFEELVGLGEYKYKYLSEEEERYRQTPRRLHKKGNVLLESRSGLYNTSTLPCPIIFLGYSDDYYSVGSNARRANIEKLTKEEVIQQVCVKKKIKINDAGPVGPINPELFVNPIVSINTGGLVSKTTIGQDVVGTIRRMNQAVDVVPEIKPRIKKYGRNPLLDVFYLNVVNPVIKTDDNFPPKSGNRYSNERIWTNPNRLPFRSNRSKKNWHRWPELEYAEFPSIFPPTWQYDIDQTNWNDRLKTTLISMENRWSMSVEYQNNDQTKPFLVLKDKTPILDLYFGLMEMHVKGVSWEEILQYTDTANSCIRNNNYTTWTSEQKITIDLVRLERLWKRVEARLEEIRTLDTATKSDLFLSSYYFEKVSLNPKKIRIPSDNNEDNTPDEPGSRNSNDRNKPLYTDETDIRSYSNIGTVLIRNSTKTPFIIERVFIENLIDDSIPFIEEDREVRDSYGRTASQYFAIKSFPKIIGSATTHLDYSQIEIEFNSFGAEPNFNYEATLVVEGSLGGERVFVISNLQALTVSDRIINYDSDKIQDLDTPSSINFGFVNHSVSDEEIKKWITTDAAIINGEPNLKQLKVTNYSQYNKIQLNYLNLRNLLITNSSTGYSVENDTNEFQFYIMPTKKLSINLPFLPKNVNIVDGIIGKNDKFPYKLEKSGRPIVILPSINMENANTEIIYISLLPSKKGFSYEAELVLDYSILPKNTLSSPGNNSELQKNIHKQKIIKLFGKT